MTFTKEQLFYEQLLENIADELNVKQIVLLSGVADGKPFKVVYNYDTLSRETIGIEVTVAGKPVDAPQTINIALEAFFNKEQ